MDGPGFTNSDPAQAIVQAVESAAQANQAAAADIAGLVETIKVEASKILAGRAVAEMHQTAKMVLLQHFKWSLIWTGFAGVGLLTLGMLIGRLTAPVNDVSGMVCQDQGGGRVCFVWVTPPQGKFQSTHP